MLKKGYPKTNLMFFTTFVVVLLQLVLDNTEVLGVSPKDAALVSIILTALSVTWNWFVDDNESVFKKISKIAYKQ